MMQEDKKKVCMGGVSGGGGLVFVLNGEETLAKISQVVLAVWMDFLTDPDCLDYIS